MMTYEIRILRSDGEILLMESKLTSDHAAIRRAQSLALPRDKVEVWREQVCVYGRADLSAAT